MAFAACVRCRAEMNISKAQDHVCEDLVELEAEAYSYHGA